MATKWRNKIKDVIYKRSVNEEIASDTEAVVEETVEEIPNVISQKKQKHISLKIGTLLIGVVSILLLIFSGSEMYSNYDTIEKAKENYSWHNYFDDYDFQQKLREISYGGYYNLIRQNMTQEEVLANIFTEIDDEVDSLNLLDNFKDMMQNDPNIQFMIQHVPTQTQQTNMQQMLADYFIDGLQESELVELNNYYQFLVQFTYDAQGNVSFNYVKGISIDDLNNHWQQIDMNNHINYTDSTLAPIKDTVMTFGVPKAMAQYGTVYWQVYYNTTDAYFQAMFPYVLIFAAVILLFVLLVPYRLLSRVGLLKLVDKIPYELRVAGLIFGIVFFLLETAPSLIYMTQTQEMLTVFNDIFPMVVEMDALFIISLLNVIVWSLAFGLWFIAVYSIKEIFVNGLWYTLKYKTITFWILRFIIKIATQFINSMTQVSLDKPFRKQLMMGLSINFVIVSFLCATWFFGIIGVFVYTGVLYWFISKHLSKFWTDYSKVKRSIAELADGNLNMVSEQDFGYFEDLKEDIKALQVGFKNAVHEEVKSSRMKTELISNVSHDLKTPLTSIVTYVNLLKNPDLTDELRLEYVETLDRKADRLKVLIEDLFEMSKASSGNITLNPVELDVVSLMQQTLFEAEDKIQAAQLQIRQQYSNEKIMLNLDSMYTYRIFENLVLNMTKYAMPCTRAYIEIIEESEQVVIVLKNMSAIEITVSPDEIVERFVRNDSSRHTEGSGLGLAISKSFVQMQHGTFEVTVDGDLFKVSITFNK